MKKVLIKTHLVGVDCEFLPNKEYDIPDSDAASIVAAGCGVYVGDDQTSDSGGGGVEPPAEDSVAAEPEAVVEDAAVVDQEPVVEEVAATDSETAAEEVVTKTTKSSKGKAK